MRKTAVAILLLLWTIPIGAIGETAYFDENGKKISFIEYEQIQRTRADNRKAEKQKRLEALKKERTKETDKKLSNHKNNQSTRKAQPKKMEYDEYGRPMYDADGNFITYQYFVIQKYCHNCGRAVPLNLRAGQPCPYCKTPFKWPKECKINEKGIAN